MLLSDIQTKTRNLRYVIYARRSTEDDERQQMSIPSQLEEVKKFAKLASLNIVDTVFESKTAKKPGRKVFNKLLSSIEVGEANAILAWHPDRLSRNSMDAGALIHLLDTGKLLDLKFPSFWFENTPQGIFMLNIAFGQSKYYVDSLSENTSRGLMAKVKKGELPGLAPKGYKNNRLTKKIVVDKKLAPHIIALFEEYSKGGLTLEGGGEFLVNRGVFSTQGNRIHKDNIKKLLTNPIYYGYFRYKGEIHKGTHKPLISKKLFDQVQTVLEGRGWKKPKPKMSLPFTGLIRCGDCGMMITSEKKVKYYKTTNRTVEYIYYKCTKKHKTRVCHNPPTNLPDLLPQINTIIKSHALPLKWKNKFLEKLDREEKQSTLDSNQLSQPIRDKLEEIPGKLDRLLNAFLDGTVPQEIYLIKKNELTSQKRTLEEKLTNIITSPNSWIEPMREWVLLAHSANQIQRPNTPYSRKQSFLLKTGSNLFLKQRKLRCIQSNPWARRLAPPLSRNFVP